MTRTRRAIAAGLMIAAAALISVPAPAMAHAELESSSPADGATLDDVPPVISFTFGEDLMPAGNAITLTDIATGSRLGLADLDVDRNTASVAWPDTAGPGQYRAAYRVVSADGHPIAGSIAFTLTSPDPQPSAPEQTQEPTAAAESPAGHTADPTTPAPSSAREENWVLGALAVLLVGGGLLTWFLRRRRHV